MGSDSLCCVIFLDRAPDAAMNDEGSLAINRSEATDRSPASWEGSAIRNKIWALPAFEWVKSIVNS